MDLRARETIVSSGLDFGSFESICQTFKKLEQMHWDLIDSTAGHGPSFLQYVATICKDRGVDPSSHDLKQYNKMYIKHKKSIPTAGALIFHDSMVLTVNVVGSPVYSLPKGKMEQGEAVWETAIREVKEETGVDLHGVIDPAAENIIVDGCTIFIIESDSIIRQFTGYNRREIHDIRWYPLTEILSGTGSRFSKLIKTAVRLSLAKLS